MADNNKETSKANLVSGEEENKRVEIHTLKSDLEKLKESGGEVLDTFSSPSKEGEKTPFTPPPFSSEEVKDVSPEEVPSPSLKKEEKQTSSGKKKISPLFLGILGAGIVILGFGLWWYIFKFNVKKPTNLPSPTPLVSNSPTPISSPISVTSPTPEVSYASFFLKPSKEKEIRLTLLTPITLKSALTKEANVNEPIGTFKEIALFKENKRVSFTDFLIAMIPDLAVVAQNLSVNIDELFKPDLGVAIIYLDNGPQLVYGGEIKNGKTDKVKQLIGALIKEKDIGKKLASNHFFIESGVADALGFRKGHLGNVDTFYLPYSYNNLAFNFGFGPDNLFLVFTSKAAFDNLSLHLSKIASQAQAINNANNLASSTFSTSTAEENASSTAEENVSSTAEENASSTAEENVSSSVSTSQ